MDPHRADALKMIDQAAIGVVAIGRNEGERLRRCLLSLQDVRHRVYVDSGSTDGSQALARELGFDVVQLAIPPGFTAARARNAGLDHLLEQRPELELVQMVDGDVELAAGWIDAGAAALEARPELAAVFGRLRERHPDASVFNMLCDKEWDGPVGEARSCGGIAMFRVAPLVAAGGYTAALIAGEEPELCLRLRRSGWKIMRIDAAMGWHDVAMTRLSQWWKRALRAGYTFAELNRLHPDGEPQWRRQRASTVLWGGLAVAALILLLLGTALPSRAALLAAAVLVLLFGVQIARLTARGRAQGMPLRNALAWGGFIMLGKIPQLQGLLRYYTNRLAGRQQALIEHKS